MIRNNKTYDLRSFTYPPSSIWNFVMNNLFLKECDKKLKVAQMIAPRKLTWQWNITNFLLRDTSSFMVVFPWSFVSFRGVSWVWWFPFESVQAAACGLQFQWGRTLRWRQRFGVPSSRVTFHSKIGQKTGRKHSHQVEGWCHQVEGWWGRGRFFSMILMMFLVVFRSKFGEDEVFFKIDPIFLKWVEEQRWGRCRWRDLGIPMSQQVLGWSPAVITSITNISRRLLMSALEKRMHEMFLYQHVGVSKK